MEVGGWVEEVVVGGGGVWGNYTEMARAAMLPSLFNR